MIYLAREHLRKSVTCDDATWLDLKSEYGLSAMLRALASKGGSSFMKIEKVFLVEKSRTKKFNRN